MNDEWLELAPDVKLPRLLAAGPAVNSAVKLPSLLAAGPARGDGRGNDKPGDLTVSPYVFSKSELERIFYNF